MLRQTNEKDLALFVSMSRIQSQRTRSLFISTVIPAFVISELKKAFQIGFMLYVPFIIVDMVVASILLSMGMMMLPPVMVSLPFKLMLFIMVDGWGLDRIARKELSLSGGAGGRARESVAKFSRYPKGFKAHGATSS